LSRRLARERGDTARLGYYEALFLLGRREYLWDLLELLASERYRIRCAVANIVAGFRLTKAETETVLRAFKAALALETAAGPISSFRGAIRDIRRARPLATPGEGDCQRGRRFILQHRSGAARSALLRASAAGHPAADRDLAILYEYGLGLRRSGKRAYRHYLTSARRGDVYAQYCVGVCFDQGIGITQNHRQAAKWFSVAAAGGYSCAQYWLGRYLRLGIGIKKDVRRGFQLARRAAESGLAEAQFSVGVCYSQGIGVRKNLRQAIRWYRAAARQGYGPAEFNLGVAYAKGRGVRRDRDEAERWYRAAARHGAT